LEQLWQRHHDFFLVSLMITKIVSSGQTGVERAALDAAFAAHLTCGGWCADGRGAEDGTIDVHYPLTRLDGGDHRAAIRQNVINSDGTAILFHGMLWGVALLARTFCQQESRPNVLIDAAKFTEVQAAAEIVRFLTEEEVRVLNVVGLRSSQWPSGHAFCAGMLMMVITQCRRKQ
jgi:hypothetical protein